MIQSVNHAHPWLELRASYLLKTHRDLSRQSLRITTFQEGQLGPHIDIKKLFIF